MDPGEIGKIGSNFKLNLWRCCLEQLSCQAMPADDMEEQSSVFCYVSSQDILIDQCPQVSLRL